MVDLAKSNKSAISAMLEVAVDKTPSWDSKDFGEILSEQLDAPFLEDIAELKVATLSNSADFQINRANPPVHTIRQVLMASPPSAQLLALAKDLAKILSSTEDFPRDVAKLIYYAILAVARYHKIPISQLDDVDLDLGISWSVAQSWIEPDIAEVLRGVVKPH